MYDGPLKRAGTKRKSVMDAAMVLRHPTSWMCFFLKRDNGTLRNLTWYRVFSSHGQNKAANRENHKPVYSTSFKRYILSRTGASVEVASAAGVSVAAGADVSITGTDASIVGSSSVVVSIIPLL